MSAYHNDPAVKTKYIARFAAHVAADEVVRGIGFNQETNKGCFVGCTLNNYNHSQFPIELGWPEWLARLADTIFEGLETQKEAAQFGVDLLEAVKVGSDLEPVKYKIAIWRHELQLERLKDNKEPYAEEVRNALTGVISFLKKSLNKEFDTESAAESAARSAESAAGSAAGSAGSAAWSAAGSAAGSAAESAARSAAESAARSAGSAAESAARSAARSAAESAARSAESAAESAAGSAAWSAAGSAAWSAAWSARSAAWSARSAAWSAGSAAWSAAGSAESAARSARSAAYVSEKEMLLKLIREA